MDSTRLSSIALIAEGVLLFIGLVWIKLRKIPLNLTF